MTFNSLQFLIFYPIVAILYFVLPRRAAWPMLLIASYYFYMCYQAELVVLILGTTLISWLASHAIVRTERVGVRRLWLTATLVVCFGVLFFYKYFNFLSGTVTGLINLFGAEASDFELNLLLPVGISFYTFQTLSYVIDVYRGDVKPERNFFFYALFVSFFPQLVAGPIERPGNLIPQLRERHRWSSENAIKGAKHMLVGFFKKVCVADVIAVYVNSVYNDVGSASAVAIIIATALFAIQIYCDFSGYTDIAIGCARIMGIKLMQNFDHPYMATTIKGFWARWHISLSGWFKDYLYIPLGGNRKRVLFNLFVVRFLTGFWHGAEWNFVVWGLFFAVLLILEKLWLYEKLQKSRVISRVYLLFAVMISFVIFNAADMKEALAYIGGMFGFGNVPLISAECVYYFRSYGVLIFGAIIGSTPIVKTMGSQFVNRFEKVTVVLRPIVLFVILGVCTAYLIDSSFNPFLYFRF